NSETGKQHFHIGALTVLDPSYLNNRKSILMPTVEERTQYLYRLLFHETVHLVDCNSLGTHKEGYHDFNAIEDLIGAASLPEFYLSDPFYTREQYFNFASTSCALYNALPKDEVK